MLHQFATLFFLMCVSHVVCDYCIQTEYVAKNKSRHFNKTDWPIILSAHALTHGGGVYIITGSLALGLAETVLHWLIDFLKCDRALDYRQDQALHIACKAVYALLIVFDVV